MSTPDVSIESIINSFFEQFVELPRQFDQRESHAFGNDEGCVFAIQLKHESFGYPANDGNNSIEEWKGRSYQQMYVMILSSKKVFYTNPSKHVYSYTDIPPNEWKNMTNHDSCWSTSGYSDLHEDDIKGHEEAFKNVPEEHRPCYHHSHKFNQVNHGFIGELVKFCSVTHERLSKDDSYFRRLTSIKDIKMKMVRVDD